MKLLKAQRVVEFEGMSLVVPVDARWLTIDPQGWIQAHGLKPWSEPNFWESQDELGVVGLVDPDAGCDWFYTKSPKYIGEAP